MPNQVVVITGASAGVGRATARAFAAAGADIGLIARDAGRLEATREEIVAAGGRALVLPLDVANADAVEGAAARVETELGPIDVWINNAMASVFSPVREMDSADYRRVTEVTYLGYVHGTLAALKHMLPRNRGGIVQVGSALAYRAIPLQSAYCAAKHAVKGFTESLRTELLHDDSGVYVSMVELPALNTPHFEWAKSRMPRRAQPVPPIYQPEVAAEAIVWAAEHHPRELLVGGSTMQGVLGEKIAPGILDHYLAANGYEAQQSPEPEDPNRPDNLWEPVAGPWAARGRFDDVAHERSLQAIVATAAAETVHRGADLMRSAADQVSALVRGKRNGDQ